MATVCEHLSVEELEERYVRCQDATASRHVQVIWLLARGHAVIADANGNVYGTTTAGGANNSGTVFEIAKTGGGYASTPTTLVSFSGTNGNGEGPEAGLIADANGNLFGTTVKGGTKNFGTVFEIAKTAGGYASPHHPGQLQQNQ